MITSIEIKNFKRLKDTKKIELNESVVLLGANNTGKTTFLQALSLWHLGLMKWMEKRSGKTSKKRTGVVINRKDILTIPVRHNKMLWADLFTLQTTRNEQGKIQGSKDINIEITISGISDGQPWQCGLEFEYRDEEVIYVRPIKDLSENIINTNPELLSRLQIFYLPTMSGLTTSEAKLLPQTILARIGEGRTAEVLRNICYLVRYPETQEQNTNRDPEKDWQYITKVLKDFFLVDLLEPELDARGEIQIFYKDHQDNRLEIISAGRGFQQILLLLSCTLLNPHAVLLIDEPDAHLEILKQREIYNLLKQVTQTRQSQLIIATHSEVLMNEAIDEDRIVIFYPVDAPKVIDIQNKGHIIRSLKDYGFQNYILAEKQKFVLYLEGSTDLDMLKSFAEVLNHPAKQIIKDIFVYYLNSNDPAISRKHFSALKDAIPELKGFALYDRIDKPLNTLNQLMEHSWRKKEFENYFFIPDLLLRWVDSQFPGMDLFTASEKEKQKEVMQQAIENIIPKYALNDPDADYWNKQHASEELDKIFREFFRQQNKPVELSKNKYFNLILLMKPEEVDKEIIEVLDNIAEHVNTRKF